MTAPTAQWTRAMEKRHDGICPLGYELIHVTHAMNVPSIEITGLERNPSPITGHKRNFHGSSRRAIFLSSPEYVNRWAQQLVLAWYQYGLPDDAVAYRVEIPVHARYREFQRDVGKEVRVYGDIPPSHLTRVTDFTIDWDPATYQYIEEEDL